VALETTHQDVCQVDAIDVDDDEREPASAVALMARET
jgi:hypothetical protein